MAKGRSLHIGLNHVDATKYQGWDGTLSGCLKDAKDMADIASNKKFDVFSIVEEKATVANVAAEVRKASKALVAGDLFFLTYSGHGGQVPNSGLDGWDDETDGLDETWCLWDRQFIDDELYSLFSEFAKGVKVFVLSDSCHSGSIVKAYLKQMQAAMAATSPVAAGHSQSAASTMPGAKVIEEGLSKAIYEANKPEYIQAKEAAMAASNGKNIGAQVLLISGCQDNQLSSDGTSNGLFTETFKQVWHSGQFAGSYKKLHASIVKKMPMWQVPNLYSVGANLGMEKTKALII